jgi:hypothetical protein
MATFEQLPGHNLQIPNLYPVMHVPAPPVYDTQAMTEHAFEFFNKVIDDLSPLKKEERRAALAKLQADTKLTNMQAQDPFGFATKMAKAKNPTYAIDYNNKLLGQRLKALQIAGEQMKLKTQTEAQQKLAEFGNNMTQAMQVAMEHQAEIEAQQSKKLEDAQNDIFYQSP